VKCSCVLFVAAALVLTAVPATAQLELRSLLEAAVRLEGIKGQRAFRSLDADGALPSTIELPVGEVHPRLTPLAPGFAAFYGHRRELASLLESHPEWRARWSPPRRLLVDRATESSRAPLYRERTGRSGRGTLIGVVDSGVDVEHADLRDAAGGTRVAWLLDLSRPPTGRHPEIEERFGCGGERACAVYSAADIDELIADDVAEDLPRDGVGHGTHVASLAAGDGSSSASGRYVGMAPEADLVVVRATRTAAAAVFDEDVLLATRFIFERAGALGRPAVVNLSLGSDFGAHDGTSSLERALAAFVGPDYPGRAIVVAAGNSGALYQGVTEDYPGPFGIHTEVHVTPGVDVRVPVLTVPTAGAAFTTGALELWITARHGDRLSVAFDAADGELVGSVEPGAVDSEESDDLSVSVINGIRSQGSAATDGAVAAVVLLDGRWPSGASFALRFHGYGTPRIWVQSATSAGTVGALLPRASKERTVTVPATSPSLIAVGATLNRASWEDATGAPVDVREHGALRDPLPDSMAYFSSAGPTANGLLKPDIVAPGAFVVGAMSAAADPRNGGRATMFNDPATCRWSASRNASCLVVDATHAIAEGTSMAAPLVSGAVALLLEGDPQLTQVDILHLLQAGARRLEGVVMVEQQAGPGALDLERTLEAASPRSGGRGEPSAATSHLTLSESYAHPDARWALQGLVSLRTADGGVADVDDGRLALNTSGQLEAFERIAPGLWRLNVAAPPRSGGQTLRLQVTLDGVSLLTRLVPIAVDRAVADAGFISRGGCSVGRGRSSEAFGWWILGAVVVLARRWGRQSFAR
jgi:subtilisin family serine protease